MSTELEKRVEELEKRVNELVTRSAYAINRDWQRTFGFSRNDAGFSELVRLGQQYRRGVAAGGEE